MGWVQVKAFCVFVKESLVWQLRNTPRNYIEFWGIAQMHVLFDMTMSELHTYFKTCFKMTFRPPQNCIEFLVIPQNVLQFQLNHVELSPNYAGTLFGITNMVANLTGFITPWVAGNITNYNVRKNSFRFRQMVFLWYLYFWPRYYRHCGLLHSYIE